MRAKGSSFAAPSHLVVSGDEEDGFRRRYTGKGTPRRLFERAGARGADWTVGYIVNKDRYEALIRGFKIHYSKRGTHIVPFEVYEEMEDA